jgi:hypothetical protein
MADRDTSRYHSLMLRLLGLEPRVSAEAVRAIEECEARCGRRLPAAVREWYSLEGVVAALAQREGACGPALLTEFLSAFADPGTDPSPRGGRRLPFYGPWRVNTGYQADVTLDGSDDPLVSGGTADDQRFSPYVLDLAWWKTTYDCPHLVVHGREAKDHAAEFGPPQYDFFAERFEELPRAVGSSFGQRSGPEALRAFLFFRPGQRVEVWVKGDPADAVRPASYTLAADTEDGLLDLYGFARPCHGVLVRLNPTTSPAGSFTARFLARFPDAEVYR